MKDLFLLVADKNAKYALEGALSRPEALGIRPIDFEIRSHSGRDGGARKTGPDLLRLELRQFRHALLILDFEGSGTDCTDAVTLESQLDKRLAAVWQDHAKSIVIEPEADVWIWGSDNAMQQVIHWQEPEAIRLWLQRKAFEMSAEGKPVRPKEAFDAVTRKCELPRSSALYKDITSRVSLSRCTDPAFLRLSAKLKEWFPVPG